MREKLSPDEQLWISQLEKFKFRYTDDFDLVIAEVVENGYVNEDILKKEADTIQTDIGNSQAQDEYFNAWRFLHDSFDNNENESLDHLFHTVKKNANYVNPSGLDSTVCFLRDFDRNEQADELIDTYIDVHRDNPKVFDLNEFPFRNDIHDERLIKEFRKITASVKPEKTLKQAISIIAEQSGYSHEDKLILSGASEEDYYTLFRNESGPHLSSWIKACLKIFIIVS